MCCKNTRSWLLLCIWPFLLRGSSIVLGPYLSFLIYLSIKEQETLTLGLIKVLFGGQGIKHVANSVGLRLCVVLLQWERAVALREAVMWMPVLLVVGAGKDIKHMHSGILMFCLLGNPCSEYTPMDMCTSKYFTWHNQLGTGKSSDLCFNRLIIYTRPPPLVQTPQINWVHRSHIPQ